MKYLLAAVAVLLLIGFPAGTANAETPPAGPSASTPAAAASIGTCQH